MNLAKIGSTGVANKILEIRKINVIIDSLCYA
jgi:hypothetical protein